MTDLHDDPQHSGVALAEPPLDIADVIVEPLWRIRLRLYWKSFKKNWRLFRTNSVGMIGLVIIAIFGLMAVMQPILINSNVWPSSVYDPVVGVDENLERRLVTIVDKPEAEVNPLTEISRRQAVFSNIPGNVGDEVEVLESHPLPPSREHLLGTDPLGRDVLSQLMFGARAAFALGIIAALVTVFIATSVGAIAAYFGGMIDSAFMRLADLLLMLPILAVLIVVNSVIPDFKVWHLALFLGLLGGFGGTAIILKSQALAVKVKPYIDAARVSGGGSRRIIFSHLIPNVMPLSFLYMMFSVTTAIATEATLSFFGLLNVEMSWGIMIQLSQAQGYLLSGLTFWWMLFPAGLAVTLLAAAFYLVGRGMDEIINPRLRRR